MTQTKCGCNELTNTLTHADGESETEREESKHSTQIELPHTEFQYLDSFPHILEKCNWIYRLAGNM